MIATESSEEKLYELYQSEYEEYLAAWQTLREARYLGVEEFRLWAKARHPEVNTVEEALRACTPYELEQAVYAIMPRECFDGQLYNGVMSRIRRRLEERQAMREAALAAAGPGKEVMPDG